MTTISDTNIIDQPLPRVPRLMLVTSSTHRLSECPKCADCAHSAEITARVTGSTGSRYTHRSTDGLMVEHSATVASKR